MKSEEFDKHIRSVMRDRELQPESGSWDRVAALLDDHENTRPSGGRRWYAVAAAIVVLAAVGAGMYLTRTDGIAPARVVETEVQAEKGAPLQDHLPEEGVQTAIPQTVVTLTAQPSEAEEISEGVRVRPTAGEMAETKPVKKGRMGTAVALEARPIQYVPRQNNRETGQARDQEIDALLAQAMAELEKEKTNATGERMNAGALLADVEEELDQNFKDKALEALKHGFVKLTTAVAERNQ